ncbi:hypothetical protein LAZ67_19000395 [Cordylochernes scorpioides]|uniref:Reverse transcriptase zinc-binding domain-containing protein n=1 Tax=Cordylochernes scorpioides TaxID=51811 RepID=A0ABY6LJB6_9ARAC|nr:hypothetical protein LAZ67_19000395 [Cordylochernes scorpioides]
MAFELATEARKLTQRKEQIIKAVEDSSCFCGIEEQTSRHLLIDCPAFQDYRMKNELWPLREVNAYYMRRLWEFHCKALIIERHFVIHWEEATIGIS